MTQFDHSISGKDPGFSGNSVSGSGGQGFDHAVPPAGGTQVLFSMLNGDSSVQNLSTNLNINGSDIAASCWLQAKNISGSTWTADIGGNLTLTGSGNPPTLDQDTPLTDETDRCLVGRTSNYGYLADSTDTADIGTEDFVIEMFIRTRNSASGTHSVFSKYVGGGSPTGYWLEQQAGGIFVFRYFDGLATEANSLSIATDVYYDSWMHIIIFCDRDEASNEGLNIFVNGKAARVTDGTAASASLSSGTKFGIMYGADSSRPYDGALVFFGLWKKADWFAGTGNTAAWTDIAVERTQKLSGFWPDVARGAKLLETMTANRNQYLDKQDTTTRVRKLYRMGYHWPRIVRRLNIYGAAITGYLSGNVVTNLFTYSQEFDNVDWVKSEVGVTANALAAPDSFNVADALVPTIVSAAHTLTQTPTLTAASYTFSVWAKAGNQNWLFLFDVTASKSAYFNIFEGYVGNSSATSAVIENWGNGWFRCAITYTGTAAAHTVRIYAADGNGSVVFAGDGAAISTYLFGAQIQLADKMSSYVKSEATAGVSTNTDFKFSGVDNVGTSGGTMMGRTYIDSTTSTTEYAIGAVSDGASNTEKIELYSDTSGNPEFLVAESSTQADITGTSDIRNGAIWALRGTWETDNFNLYVNGSSEGTPDTSGNITTDIDQLRVGTARNSGRANHNVISNFKILSKPSQILEPAEEVIPVAFGSYYKTDAAGAQTIAAGTPEKLDDTTTSIALSDFTHSNNRLTYTGTETKQFDLHAAVSGAYNQVNKYSEWMFAKNGTVLDHTKMKRDHGSGSIGSITVLGTASLATNDYVEVFVDVETNGDVTPEGIVVLVTESFS